MSAEVIGSSTESAISVETYGEEINKYLNNATKTLLDAQTLANDMNIKLSEVKSKSTELLQRISKLKFLYNCIEKQTHFLLQIILRDNIGRKVIKEDWLQYVMVDLVKTMEFWSNKINEQIRKLSGIENTLVEIDSTNTASKHIRVLSDYISTEEANTLQEKLAEIPVIEKHISNIKLQYESMVRKINDKLVNKNLRELKQIFGDKFEHETDNNMLLLNEKYPEQLIQLEDDLINFFDSLTTHFDKCQLLKDYLENKGSGSNLDYTGFNELIIVVRNDDKELDSIFKSLCEIIKDMNDFIPEYLQLIHLKNAEQEEVHDKMSKLITNLARNSEYLSIFKDIIGLIDIYKTGCLKEIETTKELTDFYVNFEKSYESLLQEVQRRKDYANQMTQIIHECQNKLQKLNYEDQNQRQEFLRRNGNYLPENIWPDEINDLTPLYTLSYNVKKI
ncbi:autophagy protein 17 [Maudiozyma exigua]|uniref:Autophagy-related protein 17 n=1 Tax=Maudiozyma exigua TaxID=34358 RepID=A0A9P6WF70_MAUEX|nr:autophagy protein 17 [Kazachstania exigua]